MNLRNLEVHDVTLVGEVGGATRVNLRASKHFKCHQKRRDDE